MGDRKNVMLHLLSLCVLCLGFVLCRYVFFEMHGMKQWPELLFIVALVSLAVSFFAKAKTTPLLISLGYIVGFVVGVMFQTDGMDAGGAKTNSLWMIWALVFVCLIVIGMVRERRKVVKKNAKF